VRYHESTFLRLFIANTLLLPSVTLRLSVVVTGLSAYELPAVVNVGWYMSLNIFAMVDSSDEALPAL